jgi:hypothetical protein
MERFSVEPSLVRPGQALSPGMPEAQGKSEAWFLDCRFPQKHFAALDFEGMFWPFSRRSPGRRRAQRGDQGRVSAGGNGWIFHGARLLGESLNHPVLQSRKVLVGNRLFGSPAA